MSDIKAVIFDSDGTLYDSFSVIVDAYKHIARTLGYDIPTTEAIHDHLRMARPITQIMQSFFPGHDMSELLALNNAYTTEKGVQLFAGAKELLQDLHKQGIRLAVVTAGDEGLIDRLKRQELHTYFTSVVHCNRVAFGKPHPEGFLLAVQECGVEPTQAVMVGDSPNDLLAGKNGRAAATIGIMHDHANRADLLAADPDWVVTSIAELRQRLYQLLDS